MNTGKQIGASNVENTQKINRNLDPIQEQDILLAKSDPSKFRQSIAFLEDNPNLNGFLFSRLQCLKDLWRSMILSSLQPYPEQEALPSDHFETMVQLYNCMRTKGKWADEAYQRAMWDTLQTYRLNKVDFERAAMLMTLPAPPQLTDSLSHIDLPYVKAHTKHAENFPCVEWTLDEELTADSLTSLLPNRMQGATREYIFDTIDALRKPDKLHILVKEIPFQLNDSRNSRSPYRGRYRSQWVLDKLYSIWHCGILYASDKEWSLMKVAGLIQELSNLATWRIVKESARKMIRVAIGRLLKHKTRLLKELGRNSSEQRIEGYGYKSGMVPKPTEEPAETPVPFLAGATPAESPLSTSGSVSFTFTLPRSVLEQSCNITFNIRNEG